MSKDDFVEKRSLNGIGAEAIGGMSFGSFLVGVGADYTKFYQSTDKKDVSGTNTDGDLTTIQGVAGLIAGKFVLLGHYYFKADYKLTSTTSTDENQSWSNPDDSYAASLMYRTGNSSYMSLNYTNINFSEVKIGSYKRKLKGSEEKINLNSFGLTYGFMF